MRLEERLEDDEGDPDAGSSWGIVLSGAPMNRRAITADAFGSGSR
jgi:hypothetical protein